MAVDGVNSGGGTRPLRRSPGRTTTHSTRSNRPRESEAAGAGEPLVDRYEFTPQGAGLSDRIRSLVDRLNEPEEGRAARLEEIRAMLERGELDQPEAFRRAAEGLLGEDSDHLPL